MSLKIDKGVLIAVPTDSPLIQRIAGERQLVVSDEAIIVAYPPDSTPRQIAEIIRAATKR